MKFPAITDKYVCIANWENIELVAITSSYLYENMKFLSIYDFPASTTEKPLTLTDSIDEHSLTKQRSEELSIKIHNSINKIGDVQDIILIQIDKKQKSYLDFLDKFNIIEINSIDDIESQLGGFAYYKQGTLAVRSQEILHGLFVASKKNLKLSIDENAPSLTYEHERNNGVIIIENNNKASTIAGINYALSINSDIYIVDSVTNEEVEHVENLIKEWQNGDTQSHYALSTILFNILADVDFSKYTFATFFTLGIPYSLSLENIIPITYVHLDRHPSQFIIDNIYFENTQPLGSAIVFSPLEFGVDEETNFVIDNFKSQNYWVKELIGSDASTFNIDMHIKEYPHDIIHICSHGGEVKGYRNIKEFTDRDGNTHNIEYDEVLSFYPEPGEELMKVESKYIWRKFDGLQWKSQDLNSLAYPHHVFIDMQTAVMQHIPGEKYQGTPIGAVADSCGIKCNAFVYQAVFNIIAGFHTAPIVFNNTCWSWSGIADSFLHSGARGYIGTLWAVNNDIAKLVAEEFYRNLFQSTVAESLHNANQQTKASNSKDIYVYWGLHFSSLKKVASAPKSRVNIAKCLLRSFYRWRRHIKTIPEGPIKENIEQLIKWNKNQLRNNFLIESIKLLERS